MTPAEAREIYIGELEAHGESITLRRLPSTDIAVRARVTGYKPDEIGGDIMQGDRKVIVFADDVTFDPPLRRGDKVVVRGALLNIAVVDDNTRRIAGELIAYELAARG